MRRTRCAYCGERITGALGSGIHSGDPDRDRLAREAARIACREHRDVAISELIHSRPVEAVEVGTESE